MFIRDISDPARLEARARDQPREAGPERAEGHGQADLRRAHGQEVVVCCAVSFVLVVIACYYRIHGLGTPPAELAHAIHERAVPRAAALFAKHGIHVTWFVVGADIDRGLGAPNAANAERMAALARAGDELGNHSYSHPYELVA